MRTGQKELAHIGARRSCLIVVVAAAFTLCSSAAPASAPRAKPSIFWTTLEEQGQSTPELSTGEFKELLANKAGVVLDARPKLEFAIAHVPGSISIDEKGLLRIVQAFPDRTTHMVVYSNGPFCDWTRRRSEELVNMGYLKVSRYQLGLAVWRALGNAAETSLEGFRHVFSESNVVIIDARSRAAYASGTIPAAESILPGEVKRAMRDRRLMYYDHGVRIVVFGSNAGEARAVADEIALNSFPNSSYFGGTYDELKRAKFYSERKPSASNLDGIAR